jgi:two-component system, NarL family, sensor histidine kinase UhpB
MKDQDKTKQQLIEELAEMRRRTSDLEGAKGDPAGANHFGTGSSTWHSLVANTPIFILVLDQDCRIRFVNHTDSGASTDQILGKVIYDFCRPEDRDTARACVQAVFQTGKPSLYEGPGLRLDDQEHWYASHIGPIFEDGKVVAASLISFNITERKRAEDELEQRVKERTAELTEANEHLKREIDRRTRAEEALREEEAKYRTLVETSPDTVILADLQGNVTFASHGILELYGSERVEDFIGRHPLEFIVEEDHERFEANLKKTLEEGVGRGREYTFIKNDGSRFPGEVSAAVIRDVADRPTAFVAIVRDITERTKAEEAVRRSEERFRSYFVQGLLGMAVTGCDKQWIEVNDRLSEILGYPREELLAMKWTEATHPDDLKAGLLEFTRMMSQEIEHYTQDKRFLRKNGEIVYATVFVRCFRRPDGAIDHFLTLIEDITERKQAEEALERERRTLKHLLQSSDHERQLIAYEIHDGLAQQLAGAIMQFDTYAHQKELEPRFAAKAFDAGMTMIRQSHVEARRLISGVRPPILDEAGIVAAVSHLVNEERRRKGPKIEYASDVDFERLTPILENAIYRIVQEGLTNACRHSKSKKVRVELVQHGDLIRIEVQDQGIGFKLEDIGENNFGVAGIRERARLLGGSAVIDSEPGKGTRIVVELPIVLRREEDE